MTYKGTLLRDLQIIVEACFHPSGRICAACGQRYGDHSPVGDYCLNLVSAEPVYLQTRFSKRDSEAITQDAGATTIHEVGNPAS
jgi:hypothetical protein